MSIFRNPSDAIASLINKGRENTEITDKDGQIDEFQFNYALSRSVKTYASYLDAAETHFDNIHIVAFDNLAKDYRTVVEEISLRYPLPIKDGYDDELVFDRESSMWSDKFDGHLPRDKDSIRLEIEKLVSSAEELPPLTYRYLKLLNRP